MPLVSDVELEQLRFPLPKVSTYSYTHIYIHTQGLIIFLIFPCFRAVFMLSVSCVHTYLQGVLRIHFLEAQDLEGKDKLFGGLIKGKSDPYGVVQVANQIFQSKTIKECLNPKWNEVFEVRTKQ